jgi:signal transduction histidine kinase
MGEGSLEQVSFEMGTVMLDGPALLDDKLQDIVVMFGAYMRAAKCSIMLINHEAMTVEVRASTNREIVGRSRNLSDVTISTRAIIDDKPFHVGSGKRFLFDRPDFSHYKSDYSLSIPIKHLDEKLGVMNFTDFEFDGNVDRETEGRVVELIRRFAACLYAVMGRERMAAKVSRLEATVRELRKINGLKADVTGRLMRDLKGPISAIVANLDMIGYDPLTSSQAECLDLATEEVYRMQNMVTDILDVLRMEGDSVEICRADVDIRSLIERQTAFFDKTLGRRRIGLRLDAPAHVCCVDDGLIGRVVVNILRNAIKHTPDGGSVTISAHCSEDPKETVVSVADQGPGVPADMRDKIFERYDGAGEGGGLGLAFCRLIVQAHGGRMWVEDSASGGARFVFTLPETLPANVS